MWLSYLLILAIIVFSIIGIFKLRAKVHAKRDARHIAMVEKELEKIKEKESK